MANDRIHNIDSKRKPIRFFYLIGDHIFKEYKDRTKFFDYMIPVIPVVDASNSYAKMREFLEKSGDYERLDDRFLRGLCLYLDDLRTVKNIVNEFQIYSAKLIGTAKDTNQLLALITYKNIYPNDFSELQLDQGYLYSIFITKDEVTKADIEVLSKEIEELKNKLTGIENEMLVSIDELVAVQRERQNYPNKFRDGRSANDWNNKVFPVRKELIMSKSDNKSQKIREALILIGNQKINIDDKRKIVDQVPTTISIRKHNYDDEIIKYILCQKYDANDIPYLIENYQKYSSELQEIIYKKIKTTTTTIKNNIVAIAGVRELLYRLFDDTGISVADKATLFDVLINDKEDVDLEKLLQKMGFSNMIKLVSGDTSRLPQIKNGVEEKAVLNILKKHGYIEDYSVDEGTNTIKVDRKRLSFVGKHGK